MNRVARVSCPATRRLAAVPITGTPGAASTSERRECCRTVRCRAASWAVTPRCVRSTGWAITRATHSRRAARGNGSATAHVTRLRARTIHPRRTTPVVFNCVCAGIAVRRGCIGASDGCAARANGCTTRRDLASGGSPHGSGTRCHTTRWIARATARCGATRRRRRHAACGNSSTRG